MILKSDTRHLTPSRYRPGVGIMLLNKNREVFVGQRADKIADAWQMPQGGIDDGENPSDAVWRELREEVGTGKADIIAESKDWLYYDLPSDLQKKLWGGKYIGQRQKWFAMRFTGVDADIKIDADAKPEFITWQWAQPNQLLDLIVPFKRDVYARVLQEFKNLLS
ncbi:MAG: RNA pyrophosphohydrolase [Alphaproteobacteria bacterium]|nr:MAG: RNA pyrophosphohydrolase [Alphaproteobacteria bacterium]